MKKLKTTKKMQNEFESFKEIINNYCSKINKEYSKNLNKLIENIAKGENLDIDMLKEKYLKTLDENKETSESEDKTFTKEAELEINMDNYTETVSETEPTNFEEIIFDKIVIDGKNYYYENKENGKIYDSFSKIVGVYRDKKYIIN
jgi:hypothetical protein